MIEAGNQGTGAIAPGAAPVIMPGVDGDDGDAFRIGLLDGLMLAAASIAGLQRKLDSLVGRSGFYCSGDSAESGTRSQKAAPGEHIWGLVLVFHHSL